MVAAFFVECAHFLVAAIIVLYYVTIFVSTKILEELILKTGYVFTAVSLLV